MHGFLKDISQIPQLKSSISESIQYLYSNPHNTNVVKFHVKLNHVCHKLRCTKVESHLLTNAKAVLYCVKIYVD